LGSLRPGGVDTDLFYSSDELGLLNLPDVPEGMVQLEGIPDNPPM